MVTWSIQTVVCTRRTSQCSQSGTHCSVSSITYHAHKRPCTVINPMGSPSAVHPLLRPFCWSRAVACLHYHPPLLSCCHPPHSADAPHRMIAAAAAVAVAAAMPGAAAAGDHYYCLAIADHLRAHWGLAWAQLLLLCSLGAPRCSVRRETGSGP